MVCAHCAHAAAIGTYELVFWGIATAIILGLRWLRDGDHWRRAALAYTAGGAAVGAFLGAVVAIVIFLEQGSVVEVLEFFGAHGSVVGHERAQQSGIVVGRAFGRHMFRSAPACL